MTTRRSQRQEDTNDRGRINSTNQGLDADNYAVKVAEGLLASALQAGHAFVPVRIDTAQRFAAQVQKLTP